MVDWILGPAEKLLMFQKGIGYSYKEAEELRKQHEQLELKCTVRFSFSVSSAITVLAKKSLNVTDQVFLKCYVTPNQGGFQYAPSS